MNLWHPSPTQNRKNNRGTRGEGEEGKSGQEEKETKRYRPCLKEIAGPAEGPCLLPSIR
jgi:hypothetical protein